MDEGHGKQREKDREVRDLSRREVRYVGRSVPWPRAAGLSFRIILRVPDYNIALQKVQPQTFQLRRMAASLTIIRQVEISGGVGIIM